MLEQGITLSQSLVSCNRMLKSASSTGMYSDDHMPTELCIELYQRIARAKPGIFVLEDSFVHPLGEQHHEQLSLTADSAVNGHEILIEKIKEISPQSKLFCELGHAGDKGALPLNSATTEQLAELPEYYLQAAKRAKDAGYDGIELHAGHTNLISRTLSGAFNRRTDKYQVGDTFLEEVLEKLKSVSIPVAIKLECEEFMPQDNGITYEETVELISRLDFDFCFVEFCGGTTDKRSTFMRDINMKKTCYYMEIMDLLRQQHLENKFNYVITGGFTTLEEAEAALAQGFSMVGFCRELLRDETFATPCQRCNKCVERLLAQGNGTCMFRSEI